MNTSPPEKKNFFNALSRKALIAVILALLPLPVSFLLSYKASSRHLQSRVLDDLSVVAEAYEGQILQFLDRCRIRARDFASDGFICDELEAFTEGRTDGARLRGHLVANKKPLDRAIDRIAVYTAAGAIVASTDPVRGKRAPSLPFPSNGMGEASVVEQNGRLYVSSPVLSRTGGRNLGFLVNEISVVEMDEVLSGELSRKHGAGTWNAGRPSSLVLYLVNKERAVIAASRRAAAGALTGTPPVDACLDEGREMRGIYRGHHGAQAVGAAMCLPSLRWAFVVEADADEVLGPPLEEMRRNALAASALVGVILSLFFLLFFRNVIAPLKRLAAAAKDIARGDFTTVIPVQTNDEIGSLSRAFNEMASEIDSRTTLLRQSEERLATAQRIARLGHWDWDVAGNELRFSQEVSRLFGVEADEPATFERVLAFVHPGDRELVKTRVRDAFERRTAFDMQFRVMAAGGGVHVVHGRAEVACDETGAPLRMSGTAQDITDLKQAEDELRILTAAIEHSVNVVFITDRQGIIEYANPTFESVTGWLREEVMGKTPRILASGVTAPAEYKKLWDTITSGKTWRGAFMNKRKDGRFYWGNTVITPIRDGRGEITHFLAVQEDVTEHKKTEERVKYLAAFDELTGLVNRARFLDLMDGWVRSLDLYGGRTACLLIVDLDEFKFVNDTYGHARGDQLIHRIGNLLGRALRDIVLDRKDPGAVVLGRMGGDEFAAFLPNFSEREGLEAAEVLRRVVEGYRTLAEAAPMTVSVGMALYPDHGENVQDLISKADAALYHSKQTGKNRIRVFHHEDRDLDFLHSKLRQKELIREAIADERFLPWFQPILDLGEASLLHYEALARLEQRDGSILLPEDFVDTAERFGLINAIDRIIIKKTMQLQARTAREGRHLTFAMNLSGKELGDEDVLAFLRKTIDETGADPPHLVFEITETAAVRDLDQAIRFVNALRDLGCRFSLDDFGVGFSSFLYLRELRVDFLKIDGSFIRNLQENGNDRSVVKAITDVAKGMGIKTIAEFVESGDVLETVRAFGVDYAQGFFIGRPVAKLPDA